MNLNHKGSLAERFIRFRSSILATQDSSSEIFNSFSVYVPSTLAADNLIDVDISGVEDEAVVKKLTVSDYKTVLKGDLLAQYEPIFRQDTNFDVAMFVVVFYVPDGLGTDVFHDYLTVSATDIDYAPLTAAFERTWPFAYFKTIFSPRYDGKSPVGEYDDQYYFDMALSLSRLCQKNLEMSYALVFLKQTLPLAAPDTNEAKILSYTRAEELENATALNVVIAGVDNPRRVFFWGMNYLMQFVNTWIVAHSEPKNLFPVIFNVWFGARNESGTFIGNKLEKIRLAGESGVKPMGVPSLLNSEANENMPLAMAEILDDKNISYLISIADGTLNDSVILRAKSVTGFPVSATMISKWVDYSTSQTVAKMMSDLGTLTSPVLRNQRTYQRIQEILINHLQAFARLGRLTDIKLNMPAYAELPASKTDIVVTQGWEATYVYDLEKVQITGTVVA